jgi:adenine-specific DNA-methyltransferase
LTTVFISGSRRIRRLSVEVRERLERIIEKRLPVVIGDADGADKAVQRYLDSREYDLVEVFCAGETPRNNVGDWPLRKIHPPHSTRDFDYYASKDREMAGAATVGLLIWDGESQGTLMNALRLVAQHKTAVVYVGPEKAFSEIRSRGDFDQLAARLSGAAARRLRDRAVQEGLYEREEEQAPLQL